MLQRVATLTSNCEIGWSWKARGSAASADMPIPGMARRSQEPTNKRGRTRLCGTRLRPAQLPLCERRLRALPWQSRLV